jgi:hypothetical protein
MFLLTSFKQIISHLPRPIPDSTLSFSSNSTVSPTLT